MHDMEEKLKNYTELRQKAKELYDSFESVRCPALNNEFVNFTSEGFTHILYRTKKSERDKSTQIMRFELLAKAKKLIELTTTYQEHEEYYRTVERRRFKRKVLEQESINDWGLIGVIDNFRIKVVIRKIGNGQNQFHSVIPAWRTKYYKDIKIVSNTTKGNVADD